LRANDSERSNLKGPDCFGASRLAMTDALIRNDLINYVNSFALITLFLFFVFYGVAFAQEEFTYDAKAKRNPFIPLVTPEGRLLKLDKQDATSVEGLAIEGIIYDKFGRSCAIVNTNVVGIGDWVGDYQVLKIQENKVIFIKDGVPLEVELTKEEAR